MKEGRPAEAIDIFEDEDLCRVREILSPARGKSEERVDRHARIDAVPKGNEPSESEDEGSRLEPQLVLGEPTDAHIKIRVRRETRSRFDSFKAELSAALGGARLMDSNLGRAVLDWLLFEIGDVVLEVAQENAGALRRPASDDLAGMAAFDDALREIIVRAVNQREVS